MDAANLRRDPPAGRGAVALAAYRPDPDLFRTQLQSIRDQTLEDFECLIGADGDAANVRELVAQSVPGDERFRVLGWDDNRGFYANFERVLAAVPADCSWVALSDHDDEWLPDKLERLVPHLARYALVSGQARVVTSGAAQILVEKTDRRVVPPEALLLQNQVTGALSVLRRDLLDLALPFPRLQTVTQVHDHWLALCAAATGGYMVLDEVIQDYVQHGSNVIGESGVGVRKRTLRERVRLVRELAINYEGGSGILDCLRVSRTLSFGWRGAVTSALLERLTSPPVWLSTYDRRAHDRTGVGALRTIIDSLRSPEVAPATTLMFVAGLPGELLLR